MDWELLGAIGVLCIAVILLLAMCRSRLAGALIMTGGLGSIVALLIASATYRDPLEQRARHRPDDHPIEEPLAGYVTSDTCRSCHPREYDTWHHSYHRTMTQSVSPESVVADFSGQELHHAGKTYRVDRSGDEFWVEMDDPDWHGLTEFQETPRVRKQLVMSTGSHHFQAYWYASGNSRVISLFPMVFQIRAQRWMPLDAAFLVPPDETQLTDQARWNTGCNKCHATHVRPGVTETAMDTRVSEFGISCEACHGPGEEHIRRMRDPLERYDRHRGGDADLSIVNPADLDPERANHVCAQCHGLNELKHPETAMKEFLSTGLTYRPGDDLLETRNIRREQPHKFWPDGMLRVSGREYNGLIRSPCYTHGDPDKGILTCIDCHQLHQQDNDGRSRAEWADDQLVAIAEPNDSCTRCHGEYRDPQTLIEHTYHGPGSSGSDCANCHMPHTAYGLLKTIRSHEIDSPSVATHLETGRPNACNLCHLDRTLAWTAEHLQHRYDQPPWERILGEAAVGPALQKDLEEVAASILWLLRGDAGQRALFGWHLGWLPARQTSGTDWMAPFLAHSLNDSYNSVRFIAGTSLQSLPGFDDLHYDFMAPDIDRLDVARQVLTAWGARDKTLPHHHRELLLSVDGEIDLSTVRRLLAQQDRKRVYLTE